MKMMVLEHPINPKCFEVLFSCDGVRYVTVDGISKEYIEDNMGYVLHSVQTFSSKAVLPYRVMAKCLAEKLLFLHTHLKYKDERKVLSKFQCLGKALCEIEAHMDSDFDIPEVVIALVNTPIS